MGIRESTVALHAGKDSTFRFLESVLDEVMELFPSKHIHIGGDECPKTRWAACAACQARMQAEGLRSEEQLQTYFINRVAQHLRKQVCTPPVPHHCHALPAACEGCSSIKVYCSKHESAYIVAEPWQRETILCACTSCR